ncbi:MAG: hypothetical protein BGN87_17690 [Rhizobiales bacterium 65-79]|nr:hypothetical protein [Hyphomicrobiales bacterium]OJU06788.1 MAG: hypothetical protein BGN87_17690 [Rhizobiales bacterium 65-79]
MFRTTDTVLIAVMVAAAAYTYQVKRGAEDQLDAINHMKTQIRLEGETIDLLKADWSLLSRPGRLQKLVDVYSDQLQLKPVEANQIVTLDDLPMRPPSPPGDGTTVARNGTDKIVTGGVKP